MTLLCKQTSRSRAVHVRFIKYFNFTLLDLVFFLLINGVLGDSIYVNCFLNTKANFKGGSLYTNSLVSFLENRGVTPLISRVNGLQQLQGSSFGILVISARCQRGWTLISGASESDVTQPQPYLLRSNCTRAGVRDAL